MVIQIPAFVYKLQNYVSVHDTFTYSTIWDLVKSPWDCVWILKQEQNFCYMWYTSVPIVIVRCWSDSVWNLTFFTQTLISSQYQEVINMSESTQITDQCQPYSIKFSIIRQRRNSDFHGSNSYPTVIIS